MCILWISVHIYIYPGICHDVGRLGGSSARGCRECWDAAVTWGLDWAGMSRMAQWMLSVSWEFSWGVSQSATLMWHLSW